MQERSLLIAKACSTEVRAHLIVFGGLVLPVLLCVFPTLIFFLATTAFLQSVPFSGSEVQQWVDRNLILLWVVVSFAIGLAAFWIARRHIRDAIEDALASRSLHAPKGRKGDMLRERVAVLWTRFGGAKQAVPRVVWFANFNVLAHASDQDGDRQIEVSSGLWERVLREDPVAEAILAHEIAHLVHRDPRVFRTLEASVTAARVILWRVSLIGVALYLYYLVANLVMAADNGSNALLLKALSDIAAVVSVLVVLPLCVIAARRYAGFIAALIEIRADVSAALWTAVIVRWSIAPPRNK